MNYGIEYTRMIEAEKVFLDQGNPRHEPFEDQDEAIGYLCRQEQVLEMAKDIALHGLNPLELFALLPDGDNAYFAAEGNRRLCAIKLLNDPELAPANLRADFSRIATTWAPVSKLFCVVFKDRDEVRLWLDRIHAGVANGRGRRQWNAEQKARNSGYSKNDLAQIMLDAAQNRGLISAEDRKGRLSTVQRYLGNPLMRDALGLDITNLDEPITNLPEDDFDIMFGYFVADVAAKQITTRDDKDRIVAYSHTLRGLDGVSGERVDRHAVYEVATKGGKITAKKPRKPAAPSKIDPNETLQARLSEIPSYKLEQLYFSLCSINVHSYTPLLAIGAWALLETLTAVCGRNSSVDFYSYLSGPKLQDLGLGVSRDTKSVREAVKRISELGNSTKHNKTSAAFNGLQLINDIETLNEMLIALASDAKGKT